MDDEERDLARASAEPMPDGLKKQIEDLIEPHTVNLQLKHRDVMRCIRVAYPHILDYLHDNGSPGDMIRLRNVADDYENEVLTAVALRAGILWRCDCQPGNWDNPESENTCGRCGAPKSRRDS